MFGAAVPNVPKPVWGVCWAKFPKLRPPPAAIPKPGVDWATAGSLEPKILLGLVLPKAGEPPNVGFVPKPLLEPNEGDVG